MLAKSSRYTALSLLLIITFLLSACTLGQEPTPTPVVAPAPSQSTPASSPAPTQAAQETVAATDTAPAAVAPTTAPLAIKNPDTLVEATTADVQTLDPSWLYDTSSYEVVFQVYESLLMTRRESTSQFVPLLATKWDASSDGKTYTFDIRKGVKFHQGQDLTPEDVAYSIWRGTMQDRSGGPQWIMLQPLFGLDVLSFKDGVVAKQHNNNWVSACEAVKKAVTFDNSAGTVTLHLKQPYGPMLQILTGPWASIVSKSWVSGLGGWNGDCATAEKYNDPKAEADELFKVMNGTGPYKFDRWKHSEEIALTRNDNYWLKEPLWQGGPSGPAQVKNVLIKIIPEWGTRFTTLKNGDADFAVVDPQYISQADPLVKETCDNNGGCAETNPSGLLRLHKNLPSVSADGIFFTQAINTVGGNDRIGSGKLDGSGIPADFFSDIHVRKAFNYCFDWDIYIKQVWHGEAEQALGPIINGELGFDPSQAHYSLDLDKCAAEFKAASLKSPEGKSLWDTGFTLQYVYDTGTDNRKVAAQILQGNLAKVNPRFKLTIAEEPWPSVLKELTDGRLPIYMINWIEDFHDPHDWVFAYLSSGGAFSGTQHFAKDLQDRLDSLITKGIETTAPQEREKIYKELQNAAYENALDIFAEQPQLRRYEQPWVKGWYYNPTYPGSGYPGTYFYVLSKGQ
ncbi:MAG: ABC transporter substrate-binding protein [Chloroflexia bacterium]